jgi:hypothetical protein
MPPVLPPWGTDVKRLTLEHKRLQRKVVLGPESEEDAAHKRGKCLLFFLLRFSLSSKSID